MSHVTCHMCCHMSSVTCHVSGICNLIFWGEGGTKSVVEQVGGGSVKNKAYPVGG